MATQSNTHIIKHARARTHTHTHTGLCLYHSSHPSQRAVGSWNQARGQTHRRFTAAEKVRTKERERETHTHTHTQAHTGTHVHTHTHSLFLPAVVSPDVFNCWHTHKLVLGSGRLAAGWVCLDCSLHTHTHTHTHTYEHTHTCRIIRTLLIFMWAEPTGSIEPVHLSQSVSLEFL